jgi:bifunctional non-homologous end joining protein LigD
MVFDFDPDDELAWKDIVQAAQISEDAARRSGLKGFLKTTGGKGLRIDSTVRLSAGVSSRVLRRRSRNC